MGAPPTFLSSVFTVNDAGQAEVRDLAAQGLRHQDVGCSQVAVDRIHLLDVCHSFGNLREQATQ